MQHRARSSRMCSGQSHTRLEEEVLFSAGAAIFLSVCVLVSVAAAGFSFILHNRVSAFYTILCNAVVWCGSRGVIGGSIL